MYNAQEGPVNFTGEVYVRELSLSDENDREIIALLDEVDMDELGDYDPNLHDYITILIKYVP